MNKERLMHSWVYNAALRDAVAQMRGILICCGAREAKGCCKKHVAWFNGSHFRPTRMISSGFQIAGFGVKVCRHHPFRVTAFRLQRACYGTNFPSSCCHSHVGMLWVPHFTPTLSQMRWYLIMRRGLAYWISVSLPYICLPFQKAGLFASHPPTPPRMSRATFYVRWHCILKSVTLIQGTGVILAQKFGFFVTAGGRTPARYWTSLCPYPTKTEKQQ